MGISIENIWVLLNDMNGYLDIVVYCIADTVGLYIMFKIIVYYVLDCSQNIGHVFSAML